VIDPIFIDADKLIRYAFGCVTKYRCAKNYHNRKNKALILKRAATDQFWMRA
jgi:hypothetical protein